MDAPLNASRGLRHGGDSQSPQKRSSNNRNRRGRGRGAGGGGRGRGNHRSPNRDRSRDREYNDDGQFGLRFRDDNRMDDFGKDIDMKRGNHGRDNMDDVVGRENGSRDNGQGGNNSGHGGPASSSLASAARVQNHGGPALPQQNQQSNLQDPSPLSAGKQQYRINKDAKPDEKLGDINKEDPRSEDPLKRITRKARGNGNGRNTESFDPASTLVRPDLRVWVGSKDKQVYNKPLKHDDGKFFLALYWLAVTMKFSCT